MRQTLEFILEHGMRGCHHLFGDDLLWRGLDRMEDEAVDPVTARQVEALTDFLEATEGLDRQRDVIASAPEHAQEVFVRLYFDRLFDYMGLNKAPLH